MAERTYNFADKICINLDQAVKTILGGHVSARDYPTKAEDHLDDEEKTLSARLMRVNHVGEVCAQALYQGQRLATKNTKLAQALNAAALEEVDHLAWTEQRIAELGGHTSYLNPVWYSGALVMGFIAGKCGDAWSLGFLAETEYQVTHHLEAYIQRLPKGDQRSFDILSVMREDELAHAEHATSQGARELPESVSKAMSLTADYMKKIAFYL